MKRLSGSLAVLVLAASVPLATLSAQTVTAHVGGGIGLGTGDLSDGTDTGWTGFAGVDYLIHSVPGLSIGATASYTHLPITGTDAAVNLPLALGEIGYLIGAASPGQIKPYVRGGVGVLSRRISVNGSYGDVSDSETKAAVGVGAGLNWMMPSVSPFVGAHFITAGSSTSYAIVYIGLGFGGGSGASSSMKR